MPLLTAAIVLSSLFVGQAAHAQTWTPLGNAGISPGGLSNWQHLIIDENNKVYVSFNDEGLPNGEGTLMRYDDTGWAVIGTPGFTAGIAHHSSFAIGPNNTYYFSYADGNNASKAAVMMYNGTSWTSIGTNLSQGECQYSSIQVVNGVPYVAFIDNGIGALVTVLKYDGTNWVSTTSSSTGTITSTPATYSTMVKDRNGDLYIAYQDVANGGKVVVRNYDGSNWNAVGTPFLSLANGGAYDISLAFNHQNVPYVAYWNPVPMGPSASVQMYDGSNWVNVGSPSFTSTIVQFTTLAFDNNDVPYLTFQDGSMNNQKSSVMTFDGTNWNYLGGAAFSAGVSAYNSIAIDGNGNPYVAYYDGGNSGKTTVMKYTVCNAPDNVAVSASDTTICGGDTVNLAVSGNLNDASKWYWYTGSCMGTLIDSGATLTVAPGDTTTYYVMGLGGCVVSGACTPMTIEADSVPKPTITVASPQLTSSAASGNQWYTGGQPINGATGHTYTATADGWYQVMVSDGTCGSMSDSVFVHVTGLSQVLKVTDVAVFPIPFDNEINVDIQLPLSHLQQWHLSVADNIGRVVYTQSILHNKNTIDLKYLSSGIYFLTIDAPTGRQVYKVVKND